MDTFESEFTTRRRMLKQSAMGFGSLAFAAMLDEQARADAARATRLAPKPPHLKPRAKRVIFLFMKGGPSHVDTFDYKPRLQRDDGKPLPFAKPRVQFAQTGKLLGSPWKFRRYGESGIDVSDLFPHVARCVDDLCILNSLHGSNAAHGGALLKLHTGSDTFVRPSMGSWVTYGLGTENQNLPGFITICPTLAHGGVRNWGSAFLPAAYQGTPLGNRQPAVGPGPGPLHSQPARRPRSSGSSSTCIAGLNRDHLEATGPNPALEGRLEFVRAGLPDAVGDARGPGRRGRVPRDPAALRPRRPRHGELRPPVPDGPPIRRARRAVRPGHAQRLRRAVGPAQRAQARATRRTPARSTGRSPAS